MFPDYERLVLEDYQQKKSHNILSSGLAHPTQARLKKECIRLCRGEIKNKDEKVIRDFCEEWDNEKTCFQNITKHDVDKFKPLSNFLKGDTESTDFKNIQLLAWLIDFPDRPFDYTKDYSQPGVGKQEPEENIPGVDAPKDDPQQIQIVKPKLRFRKLLVVGVLLVFIPTCNYLWWTKTWRAKIPSGNGGCMYWVEDHYQQIPCSQKLENTLVIALDSEKLNNLKKITCPDTITEASIGKVWYAVFHKNYEYYTSSGFHPIDPRLRLLPLTKFIIQRHLTRNIISRINILYFD